MFLQTRFLKIGKSPHHKEALKRNSYQKAQAQKDKSHRAETKYDFSLTEEISGETCFVNR